MSRVNDNGAGGTVKLTLAQAVVRWLANQYIVVDGEELRLFGGGFGIFGHGNVPCLGEACLLYTSPSPRDKRQSRMPSSA